MRVVFEHEAEQEMIEAADFYDAENTGLGSDFLDEVESASDLLAADPQRFDFAIGRLEASS